MFLFRMLRARGGRTMDPLQVSMTGVRMGERFLQIGCDDRSLLSGLAAKVGLSGSAAVASLNDQAAARAAAVGTKVGALIDVRPAGSVGLPFDEIDHFDLVVVDDTRGGIAALDASQRTAYLRDARRLVRPGGRIEVVEGLGGGLLGGTIARPAGYDVARDLEQAGFKPVRVLAEKDGYRFVEGLRPTRAGGQDAR